MPLDSRVFLAICFVVTFGLGGMVQADETAKIKQLIKSYETAINASDVKSVVSLFAKDAVFMPVNSATAVGPEKIGKAYAAEFKNIDLDVNIIIDELEQQGDFAFARTRSKGKLKILANNMMVDPKDYRAFFVLQKNNDQWKIARFMFNFSAKRGKH